MPPGSGKSDVLPRAPPRGRSRYAPTVPFQACCQCRPAGGGRSECLWPRIRPLLTRTLSGGVLHGRSRRGRIQPASSSRMRAAERYELISPVPLSRLGGRLPARDSAPELRSAGARGPSWRGARVEAAARPSRFGASPAPCGLHGASRDGHQDPGSCVLGKWGLSPFQSRRRGRGRGHGHPCTAPSRPAPARPGPARPRPALGLRNMVCCHFVSGTCPSAVTLYCRLRTPNPEGKERPWAGPAGKDQLCFQLERSCGLAGAGRVIP